MKIQFSSNTSPIVVAFLLIVLLGGGGSATALPLFVYVIAPTSKHKVLPDTPPTSFPLQNKSEQVISVRACRGEYEPASFVMRSDIRLSGLSIISSDLVGPKGAVIERRAIDVRLVKCWYQAGTAVKKGRKVLVPELLLKDDSLVKVDESGGTNYLRVKLAGNDQYIDISSSTAVFPDKAQVYDSKELVPFDLPENFNKQVWLTVHVPNDAHSGLYLGTVSISVGRKVVKDIPITLEVFPFELKSPALEYGIYYTASLADGSVSEITSKRKSLKQYEAELRDMKEHGIVYPTLYQSLEDEALLNKALAARNTIGLPKDKIYTKALPAKISALPGYLSKWRDIISHHGYRDLYVYGKDEARGPKLQAQRAAWRKVHDAGAKVYVACHAGAVDLVGDVLDLPVLSGGFQPEEVEKWHALEKKVFIYNNPQVGIENPEIYRRNFGVRALCNGYDGVMDFAYQHEFGHIWNDFDRRSTGGRDLFRDHVFAYPTSDGVIDTIQWEGFREAVDDVRYLTTLASVTGTTNFRLLCEGLLQHEDLDDLRKTIVDRIISNAHRLQK